MWHFFYAGVLCLASSIFLFMPWFARASKPVEQIEKCCEGTDRWGLWCTSLDLSFWLVLEADCTPCYVNDVSLGSSREAVSGKWRTSPPFLLMPLGNLTGSHHWHGKQTWSGMVWSVPPGHRSHRAKQHSCPLPLICFPFMRDLMRYHDKQQADMLATLLTPT